MSPRILILLMCLVFVSCRTPYRGGEGGTPEEPTSQTAPVPDAGTARLVLAPETSTSFGLVAVGAMSELTVLVTNPGTAPAVGLRAEMSAALSFKGGAYPGSSGDCGADLPAGKTCALALAFTPVVVGDYLLAFSLAHRDYGAVTIELTGRGVQPGGLDLAFGAEGKLTAAIGASFDEARGIAVHEGKVVVAGSSHNGSDYDFAVVRYSAEGLVDTSFGSAGVFTTGFDFRNDQGQAVAVQPDGKIVVAGYAFNGTNNDFAVIRLTSAGALDPSFGNNGKVLVDLGGASDFGYALALQVDGRILVAGSARVGSTDDFAAVRLENTGALDTSFGVNGIVTFPIGVGTDEARAVTVLGDGKILLAGNVRNGGRFEMGLARLEPDGSLDGSFNGTGTVTTAVGGQNDFAYALAVQPNGRILLAGRSHNGSDYDFALVRFLADGSLDGSFDGDGTVTASFGSGNEEARALILQSDGKIVVGGFAQSEATSYDFAMIRYHSTGAPDVSFANLGMVTTPFSSDIDRIHALAVASDGGIVAAGDSYTGGSNDFAVAKFYP